MEVMQRVTVPASAGDVRRFVLDLPSVISCIPGAHVKDPVGDGSYHASLDITAAEFSVSFAGTASVETTSDDSARVRATGSDKMGTIRAEADIAVHVQSVDERRCDVEIKAAFEFAGLFALAARSGGKPVANLLMKKFSQCLVHHFET